MRKYILLFFVSILVSVITACDSDINQKHEISIKDDTSENINKFKIIDTFIELYNKSNSTKIDNTIKMDIQGKDYQTEFRLNAFKNAVGKKGDIDNSTIKIVNYGAWKNDTIRFYIQTQTQKKAIKIYTNIIHILDNTITDKEIINSYDSLNNGYDANILLGESSYISGYINKKEKGKFEIMIDCKEINFIN